jgi:hypothetical protein
MAVRAGRLRNAWKRWDIKGAVAGMIGGVPMALYLVLICGAVGLGYLFPPNAVATNWVRFRPVGPAFVPAALITGTIQHLVMSAFWGIGLAAVVQRFGRTLTATWPRAIGTGLCWGLLAFSTTWLLGQGISPGIMWIPRGHAFLAHLLYGVTTALILRTWLVRPKLRVIFAPKEAAVRQDRVRAGD